MCFNLLINIVILTLHFAPPPRLIMGGYYYVLTYKTQYTYNINTAAHLFFVGKR